MLILQIIVSSDRSNEIGTQKGKAGDSIGKGTTAKPSTIHHQEKTQGKSNTEGNKLSPKLHGGKKDQPELVPLDNNTVSEQAPRDINSDRAKSPKIEIDMVPMTMVPHSRLFFMGIFLSFLLLVNFKRDHIRDAV